MDKYTEALNNISNYEIWHTATYDDDGYCNDDDWTEYPFDDSEDIKLLSKLINKYDILNKGIDELIEKYENKVEQRKVKIIFNETFKDDRMLELNNQAELIYQEIVQDLKKLKGE